jgi:hypothetical protein
MSTVKDAPKSTAKSTIVEKPLTVAEKIAAYEPTVTGKWAGKEVSADEERSKRVAMRTKALTRMASKK